MTYTTWDEKFDTGIEVIDFQHRKIVAMLNDLHTASLRSKTETATSILKKMRDYVTEHFSFEEELLREANYQFIKAHTTLHQRFIERLDNLTHQHESGEQVTDELSDFLSRWMTHHIGYEDQDYVDDVRGIMKDICI